MDYQEKYYYQIDLQSDSERQWFEDLHNACAEGRFQSFMGGNVPHIGMSSPPCLIEPEKVIFSHEFSGDFQDEVAPVIQQFLAQHRHNDVARVLVSQDATTASADAYGGIQYRIDKDGVRALATNQLDRLLDDPAYQSIAQGGWIDSARDCAKHVIDSDAEKEDFAEYVEKSHDPRGHVYFHALRVGGLDGAANEHLDKFRLSQSPDID